MKCIIAVLFLLVRNYRKKKYIKKYYSTKKEQEEKDKFSREQQARLKKRDYLLTQLREKEKINTTIENVSAEFKREKSEMESRNRELKKIGVVVFVIKEFETVKKQVDEFYKKYQKNPNRYIGLIKECIEHNYYDVYSMPLILNKLLEV